MLIFDLAMEHWQYTLLAWFLLSFPAGTLVGYCLRAPEPEPMQPVAAIGIWSTLVSWNDDPDTSYDDRIRLVNYLRSCPATAYSNARAFVVDSQGVCTRGS